ncbi:MAG TPA: TetR/AcrR family transcriptional regulator [Candidatus Bathyarchaeia archaeon]|nr:TetR/AcrR family transcriptional regulator [Candidatus Bathyarchaeia archaeon]
MATLRKPAPELAPDGRVRRSQRSGQAIVEALIELVGEGVVEPTAQQVARRARLGIRTVFRRFTDMESLFAEMEARLHAEAVPLLLGGQVRGTIARRARALVRRRAMFFERIAPYKRSGNLKRPRSPFLRERHALLVLGLRADLKRWLPEVLRAPREVVDALDLATSFEAWDRLRTEQRLGPRRARLVVERLVLAIVCTLDGSRGVANVP